MSPVTCEACVCLQSCVRPVCVPPVMCEACVCLYVCVTTVMLGVCVCLCHVCTDDLHHVPPGGLTPCIAPWGPLLQSWTEAPDGPWALLPNLTTAVLCPPSPQSVSLLPAQSWSAAAGPKLQASLAAPGPGPTPHTSTKAPRWCQCPQHHLPLLSLHLP